MKNAKNALMDALIGTHAFTIGTDAALKCRIYDIVEYNNLLVSKFGHQVVEEVNINFDNDLSNSKMVEDIARSNLDFSKISRGQKMIKINLYNDRILV